MKKSVIVTFLLLCTNSIFAQQILFNDIDSLIVSTRSVWDPYYWNKTNLYYSFRNYSSQFTNEECETVIRKAFNTWSKYTPFTFTRINNTNLADIEISWESDSNHGDCPDFSEVSLAHASVGVFNQTPPGYIHFNDAKLVISTYSAQFDSRTYVEFERIPDPIVPEALK